MSNENEGRIRWGEIFLCHLGKSNNSVQAGTRPVLIVQNDVGNTFSSTVIVAPITSSVKRLNLPTHVLLHQSCGLRSPSVAMLEQLRTVDKKDLYKYLGKVRDWQTIEEIKEAISVEFNLDEKPYPEKTNLCYSCLQKLREEPNLTVRPWGKRYDQKVPCDICQRGFGYAYAIRKKRSQTQSYGINE